MGKKYVTYLIVCQIIVVILIATLNYIIDPLLYYQRDKRILPILYTEDQRHLIPGLIKNSRDHNTAIIGTSMGGIFRASEVSELLDEKTVKLTVNGATLLEQSYILSRYLSAQPNAKTIIWVIDPMYFDINPELFTIRPYDYPFFLYDASTVNLQYLLNYEVTIHSLQTIISDLLGIRFYMKTGDLDSIHTWPPDTPTGCKQIIKNYRKMSTKHFDVIDPILVPMSDFNKENASVNIDKITDLAKNRKDIHFYFILPPYSIIRYLFENEKNGFERILKARNFFANKTQGNYNIKVIDLQASEDIITDLAHYIDMLHHDKTVTKRIITNIINENFDEYESVLENSKKLRTLIDKYDFEKIKNCELL